MEEPLYRPPAPSPHPLADPLDSSGLDLTPEKRKRSSRKLRLARNENYPPTGQSNYQSGLHYISGQSNILSMVKLSVMHAAVVYSLCVWARELSNSSTDRAIVHYYRVVMIVHTIEGDMERSCVR